MIRLFQGLTKLVQALETEEIGYMIVGGFAASYYNRFRVTTDIDCVLQIYPPGIERLVKHFPEWLPFVPAFRDNAKRGIVFNLTDFDSGVKYDFMVYQDSDYNWKAFERRRLVDFMGIACYIAAPEDLIISKLQWYHISKSGKQWDDLEFLIQLEGLNMEYLELWTTKLFIKRYGLF
ncbi:MAG: hypothetical protein IPM81_06175 [Saprospirales bacterium]|nr:hypothetical protein [Saprospirales bacterium]